MHKTSVRIYYEDTDAGGIVYYANYFKFAERARSEYLRDKGFSNSTMMDEHGIGIVVRHVAADFFKPARLDDEVIIETTVEQIKNASFIMQQKIVKEGLPLVTMIVKLACIDLQSGKPNPIPRALKETMQ